MRSRGDLFGKEKSEGKKKSIMWICEACQQWFKNGLSRMKYISIVMICPS